MNQHTFFVDDVYTGLSRLCKRFAIPGDAGVFSICTAPKSEQGSQ